jgi:hypothetical protein
MAWQNYTLTLFSCVPLAHCLTKIYTHTIFLCPIGPWPDNNIYSLFFLVSHWPMAYQKCTLTLFSCVPLYILTVHGPMGHGIIKCLYILPVHGPMGHGIRQQMYILQSMGHKTRECVYILPVHGLMGHGVRQWVYILQAMGQWDTRQEKCTLTLLSCSPLANGLTKTYTLSVFLCPIGPWPIKNVYSFRFLVFHWPMAWQKYTLTLFSCVPLYI